MDMNWILKKAKIDNEFRTQLIKDAKRTIEQELGVILPEDIEIRIHESTIDIIHLVLPAKPESSQRRSKNDPA